MPSTARLGFSMACELEEVRPIAKATREFLAAKGLSENELMACELVLVEACNNAVLYVIPSRQLEPIGVEIFCDDSKIEIQIHDHTAGFELPEQVDLTDLESESGRGLFIIQSLMDDVSYAGGFGENTLTLRKIRPPQNKEIISEKTIEKLKLKLAENEQIIDDMTEEISSCYESLSAIFRSGAELGKSHNLQTFSRSLCDDLLKINSADWFLLRIAPKDDTALSVFVSSDSSVQLPSISPVNSDVHSFAEIKAATSQKDVWFNSRNPLHPNDPLHAMPAARVGLVHPFYFSETLIGTLAIGKTRAEHPFTSAHLNVIHTVSDFLAMQIVNARLYEERLNHGLVTRELEIAREIQRALLPKKLPRLPGFALAGFCESARHVGGDFYDAVQIDEHSALLVIADVMGKGVPAAMFAAILRSILRGSPELVRQPAALLTRVNGLLHEELSDVEMFITAQLAFIDVRKRELIVANAGHCPALLFCENNPVPKQISPEGMPLGILRNALFTEVKEPLFHQCRVVFYTDGVTESRNANDQFFGHQRLVDWMSATAGKFLTAEQLKESLAAELNLFRDRSAPSDDQTFLILAENFLN